MNINWQQVGTVVFTGLVVVFIALIILVLLVMIFGKILSSIQGPGNKNEDAQASYVPIKAATPPAPVPAAPPVVENGIEEEVVAVISAAVSAAMDGNSSPGNYAIASISHSPSPAPSGPPAPPVSSSPSARPAWGFAGMQQNTRPF